MKDKDGATLNGFATVRIIDVNNGNVIASFHRPSGKLWRGASIKQ